MRNKSTHWIGKDGKEYSINEYMNWGGGVAKNGKKDLPKHNYPYTIKTTDKINNLTKGKKSSWIKDVENRIKK